MQRFPNLWLDPVLKNAVLADLPSDQPLKVMIIKHGDRRGCCG
jgi:hypothetical protein